MDAGDRLPSWEKRKKPLPFPGLAGSGVRASFPAPGQGLRTRACAPAALAAARALMGALRLLPDPREATEQASSRPQASPKQAPTTAPM